MPLRVALLLAASVVSSTCVALESAVQRQILQRDQSQAELRLEMQQQQERALNPPQSSSVDTQRRMLERDQQQRLRQFQEHQAREQIAPADDAQRKVERQRRAQTTAEELNRLERERQLETERARDGQP